MKACKDLSDYAEYTYRVRKYAKEMPIEDAVERTINECIQEGILKDFLLQNRAEAKKVSIYEYNEEEHMRMERKDAYEDGVAAGREEGLTAGRKEERSQLFELISKLSSDGLSELIPKLASDPDFYHEMMRKYFG
jgi:flagellar biosynthesis/type III secretory pathway protein FliH